MTPTCPNCSALLQYVTTDITYHRIDSMEPDGSIALGAVVDQIDGDEPPHFHCDSCDEQYTFDTESESFRRLDGLDD